METVSFVIININPKKVNDQEDSNYDWNEQIKQAKKEGYSDSDIAKTLGLNLQKDLGVQQPIKVSATRQPFDWQAAAWQRALALTLLIVAGGSSYFIALFALGFRPRQFMRREQ